MPDLEPPIIDERQDPIDNIVDDLNQDDIPAQNLDAGGEEENDAAQDNQILEDPIEGDNGEPREE